MESLGTRVQQGDEDALTMFMRLEDEFYRTLEVDQGSESSDSDATDEENIGQGRGESERTGAGRERPALLVTPESDDSVPEGDGATKANTEGE